MTFVIAAVLAAAQPAVVQAAPVPAPHSQMGQMGQASPKKEECCCKDKMDKEHASHDMDRMQDHQSHSGR
jgi:hypothetical protein